MSRIGQQFGALMVRLGLEESAESFERYDAVQCAAYLLEKAAIGSATCDDVARMCESLASANRYDALDARSDLVKIISTAANHSVMQQATRVRAQARSITSGSFPAVKAKGRDG